MNLRTGIFGGTFNPIHCGHVGLSEWLVREGWVDEVWWMVSPQNPFKRNMQLLDERQRLEMAKLAAEGRPALKVSDFEFSLPRPSYTWFTLQALRAAYPERIFSLIIGADNWAHFRQWVRPDEIMAHHQILVYPRAGFPLRQDEMPPGVQGVNAPLLTVSSTQIRRMIRDGEDVSALLPAQVFAYIKAHGLYSSDARKA